jgi:hypothetical protein
MHQRSFAFSIPVLTCFGMSYAEDRIPVEAQAVVEKVHVASAKQDLSSIRSLMIDEFTWSFGGDSNASQAIGYWREHPEVLRAMSRATKSGCEFRSGYIQCPRRAGMGYRAGFKLTEKGWRMAYFVAGD